MEITEYKKIVVSLRPSLIAIARKITGNMQDAEDAVQDVFLKIWHRRNLIDRYENIEAYSVMMVKNMCIDKLRTRRASVDESTLLSCETTDKQPDRLLEQKDTTDIIRQMMLTLPPLQQRILRMKELEGYDTDEIVEITGIAAEAVRNNLSRARKKLRELYLNHV